MRHREYVGTRYRALAGYVGSLTLAIGVIYLLPLLVLFFYPHERSYALPFALLGGVMIGAGYFARQHYTPPNADQEINMQEGALVVTVTWLVAMFTGSIPLMATVNLTPTQAIFESTSAWTGTGLTVVDVLLAPNIVLFYRSLLQLAGGAGLVIVALTAVTGPIGYGLSIMEGRSDKLAPHVRRSARLVLMLYSSYVVLGIFGLWAVGMEPFDAINHSFTAVATGGFSTRIESIGYWDSAAVEAVIIVLMVAGTTNFLTAYTLLRGRFQAVGHNGEIRLMALLWVLSIVVLVGLVTVGLYPTLGKALRVAVFESMSAISTTGFNTVVYTEWADFGWLVLIALMLVGGGSGSTSGAIKLFRIYVMFKAIEWEIRRAFLPRHAVNEPKIWQGDDFSPLSDARVRRAALFIGLYVTVFIAGTGIMTAYGYSLRESMFEFASTLGTVGLSVGVTSSQTPPSLLWVQILAMLLGRLELFAVLIASVKVIEDLPLLARGR